MLLEASLSQQQQQNENENDDRRDRGHGGRIRSGRRDYGTARSLFEHLLNNGYIPSKLLMLSIGRTLGFVHKKGYVYASRENSDADKFRFLLFVVDAMRK